MAAPRDEEVLARSDWLDVELERAGSAAGSPGAAQGPHGACAAVFVDGAYVGGVCGARGSVWVGARPGVPALGAGAHRLRVVRARLGGLAADAVLDFGSAAETGFFVRSGPGGGGGGAALEGFAAPARAEWVWADGALPAGGAAARWLLEWAVRGGGAAALLGRVGFSVAPAGAPDRACAGEQGACATEDAGRCGEDAGREWAVWWQDAHPAEAGPTGRSARDGANGTDGVVVSLDPGPAARAGGGAVLLRDLAAGTELARVAFPAAPRGPGAAAAPDADAPAGPRAGRGAAADGAAAFETAEPDDGGAELFCASPAGVDRSVPGHLPGWLWLARAGGARQHASLLAVRAERYALHGLRVAAHGADARITFVVTNDAQVACESGPAFNDNDPAHVRSRTRVLLVLTAPASRARYPC